MLLIIFSLWLLYSALEGFREAYYWFYKGKSNDVSKYEIHPVFALQRGIVLSVIFIVVLLTTTQIHGLMLLYSSIKSISFIVSLMLIFSFIHNGMYYKTRNELNNKIYKLRWKAHSKTSTAKWTKFLTFRNRTIMFIIGLIIIILCII